MIHVTPPLGSFERLGANALKDAAADTCPAFVSAFGSDGLAEAVIAAIDRWPRGTAPPERGRYAEEFFPTWDREAWTLRGALAPDNRSHT